MSTVRSRRYCRGKGGHAGFAYFSRTRWGGATAGQDRTSVSRDSPSWQRATLFIRAPKQPQLLSAKNPALGTLSVLWMQAMVAAYRSTRADAWLSRGRRFLYLPPP